LESKDRVQAETGAATPPTTILIRYREWTGTPGDEGSYPDDDLKAVAVEAPGDSLARTELPY